MMLVWGSFIYFPSSSSSSPFIIIIFFFFYVHHWCTSCSLPSYHGFFSKPHISNDILNLCIVINYLCIQAWFSLVHKTKKATQSLLSCLSVGYGQLAHAILSLWFTLLAIPSWLLSTLLPPLLGGGAIAVAVAATAVLLGSSLSSSVFIDPTACYLDTGYTSVMTCPPLRPGIWGL